MKNIFLLSLILFFSCASQGIPRGGPIDKEGPIITSLVFESSSILKNEPMVILFNEIVNPLSVKQSIQINGQNNFTIRVKYNKVIIYPLNKWDEIIELNISRNVSDYQNNIMDAPVSKIFKIKSIDFFKGIIKGKLFNIIADEIYEIALYQIRNNDLIYIKKTESDINGNFQFQNIDNGQYRLCALEGIIGNFEEDYRFNRYGIQSENIIINSQNHTLDTKIIINAPLVRERIVGVEILNGNYALLTLSNGTEKSIYIESNRDSKSYITGDSVFLRFDYHNRLETYSMPPFSLIANINQDTLSPKIDSYYFKDRVFHINFSEPIKLLKSDPFFTKNGKRLDYSILDPLNLIVDVKDYNSIHIYENSIADFNDNLIDSLMIVDFSVLESSDQKFGSLKGKVSYKDMNNIIVRLTSIDSNNKYHISVDMQDSSFIFQDVFPGEYILDSYESKQLNPEVYYSGVWEPFERAAQFTIYPENIDIRAHWVIEGIEIIYD